jgi:hypothetical protein
MTILIVTLAIGLGWLGAVAATLSLAQRRHEKSFSVQEVRVEARRR